MRWFAFLILLAGCGPDLQVMPDANFDARPPWCPTCDRETEYCVIPPLVAVAGGSADDCRPFPAECGECDCVLGSLTSNTCPEPGPLPRCEVLEDGLVLVSCPGGP